MHRSDWSTCFLLTQPKHNRLLLHIVAVSDQFARVVGGCRFMQRLSMNGIMIHHVGGKVTRALHKKHKCTRYMLWETHSILTHLLQHWHCYISPPINLVNLWLTPGWKAPNLWLTPGLKALPASVTRLDTKSILFGFESNILASPTRYKYVWEVGICHERKSVYLLVNWLYWAHVSGVTQ